MHFGRKKTLIDRAQEYVDQISDSVIPQLEAAWEQAVDKAGPALSDARDRATPLIAEGRALATEKASAGAALAAERASMAADKASVGAGLAAALAADKASAGRDLAAAKVARLKGEPEPQGGKLKKVLLLSGLLAIAGFVAAKLKSSKSDSANWQSSYVPTPPPAPGSRSTSAAASTGAAAGAAAAVAPVTGDPLTDPLPEDVTAEDVVTVDPPATDDIGGGAPGEAISDTVMEPHEPTTPDDPAQIVDIDDVPHR